MTVRTARKILTGKSRFTKSWSHVMRARAKVRNHREFYLFTLSHSEFTQLNSQ